MMAEGEQMHGSAETTLPACEETPASALRSGDVVDGRYRIERRMGRGGFGAVYAAEHLGTGQSVALKVRLAADDPDESVDIQRFAREARITARLRHPNTVRVFDLGLTRVGAPYIAMELLSGPTLEHVLRERAADGVALSQDESIDIALAVLASLSEAHGLGLVHRDLKPANLMFDTVDGANLIKLLDFGIARQSGSSLTASGASLGTPAYMSPEQCQALELDGRSDLYSLGVILFRCVTGQLPFPDGPPMAMMYCHTSQPPPDLASMARTAVTDGFVASVMRCLAKEPARRFQSAREMHDMLTSIGWSESTGSLGALPPASGKGGGRGGRGGAPRRARIHAIHGRAVGQARRGASIAGRCRNGRTAGQAHHLALGLRDRCARGCRGVAWRPAP